MIIDFHTHVFSPAIRERREELCQVDACFATLYSNRKSKLASVEELLTSMDRCGIGASVVQNIGWMSNKLCGENNDYILKVAAEYPDRLIGFCSCQPRDGDASLREIERCIRSGAKGIGELRPDVQGYKLSDGKVVQPLFEYAVSNKLVVSIHASEPVGHEYAGKGETYPQTLYELACKYPELNLVAAHLGGGLPFYELMPEVQINLKNVYYDTAAMPFLYRPDTLRALSLMTSSEKILFGSDWPLLSQSRVLRYIESAGLSREINVGIKGDNADRILRLK